MKESLIIGGSGFIGKNLLTQVDADVYDKEFGQDIFDSGLEKAIESYDIIYHLAAETSVSESFKRPGDFYRTNVLGTARVIELCRKYHKKLIYPSSASVYFPDLSPYAKSKYQAEQILSEFFPDFPIVILRLFNVFGPGMNPRTGSVMYRFLHDDPITVQGTGEQTRDYIHIRDVVSVMLAAQDKKWDGCIVDVGTGRATSTNHIAELFRYYRKIKIEYTAPVREIKWSVADTQKLHMLYGDELTTDLKKDIGELCRS